MAKVSYALVIGNLMYAIVCTTLDIAHVLGILSRYMSNLGKQHWEAVKWIIKYLRGITNTMSCFRKTDLVVQDYVDADMASDIDNRKSTTIMSLY